MEALPRIGLTPKQALVLQFLKQYHKEYGVYPTVREICKGKIDGQQVIKKSSAPSNVQRILECLKRKGWILKEVASPRGIAILP
jgi:SOS-response transcriptional repressor LexA